jgi:hypothetical protein
MRCQRALGALPCVASAHRRNFVAHSSADQNPFSKINLRWKYRRKYLRIESAPDRRRRDRGRPQAGWAEVLAASPASSRPSARCTVNIRSMDMRLMRNEHRVETLERGTQGASALGRMQREMESPNGGEICALQPRFRERWNLAPLGLDCGLRSGLSNLAPIRGWLLRCGNKSRICFDHPTAEVFGTSGYAWRLTVERLCFASRVMWSFSLRGSVDHIMIGACRTSFPARLGCRTTWEGRPAQHFAPHLAERA